MSENNSASSSSRNSSQATDKAKISSANKNHAKQNNIIYDTFGRGMPIRAQSSALSLGDLSTISNSDISKFFRTNSTLDASASSLKLKGLNVSEIPTKTTNSNVNLATISSVSPSRGSNDEGLTFTASSVYPPTINQDSRKSIHDIEKQEDLNNVLKKPKQQKIMNFIEGAKQWQWFKIVGMFMVIAGACSCILAATIYAAKNEYKSKHSIENNSLFGKQFRKVVNIRTSMVDPDTPDKYKHWKSSLDDNWDLVFSDEFNCEGRTFYPGDDQFWEAVDIHYAATENMEWLDPNYVSTVNGTLRITMDKKKSHGLNYTSALIQSWNKLCFTQGYVETSIKMPGTANSSGLWPAFWSLGNLARAGYMASTEGTWPYSYDACDVGVTANQSSSDGLSLLPGQKLNSCICKGEDHPNPGTARSAPEIDIMEGLYNDYAQTFNVAPFDLWRYPDYDHIAISNFSTTAMNSFMGTPFQEAVSAVVKTNKQWYNDGNFIKFGMEYRNDLKNRMDNFINFYINDKLTFRVTEGAFHPDGNINWRLIPREPMSLILNLGLSKAWSLVDLESIKFPIFMDVDYIRIYQPKGKHSLTCDPKKYPTTEYIQKHINAYTNANLTSWKQAGYSFPKYSLDKKCKK